MPSLSEVIASLVHDQKVIFVKNNNLFRKTQFYFCRGSKLKKIYCVDCKDIIF